MHQAVEGMDVQSWAVVLLSLMVCLIRSQVTVYFICKAYGSKDSKAKVHRRRKRQQKKSRKISPSGNSS